MFNIDKTQKLNRIIEILKKSNRFNLETTNFWEVYDNFPKKEQLGLPSTSTELYKEYQDYFNRKTWYNILELNTTKWYQTIKECRKALKKIYDMKYDDKLYKKASLKDNKLPVNPYEFYKLYGFKNVKESFNTQHEIEDISI